MAVMCLRLNARERTTNGREQLWHASLAAHAKREYVSDRHGSYFKLIVDSATVRVLDVPCASRWAWNASMNSLPVSQRRSQLCRRPGLSSSLLTFFEALRRHRPSKIDWRTSRKN